MCGAHSQFILYNPYYALYSHTTYIYSCTMHQEINAILYVIGIYSQKLDIEIFYSFYLIFLFVSIPSFTLYALIMGVQCALCTFVIHINRLQARQSKVHAPNYSEGFFQLVPKCTIFIFSPLFIFWNLLKIGREMQAKVGFGKWVVA